MGLVEGLELEAKLARAKVFRLVGDAGAVMRPETWALIDGVGTVLLREIALRLGDALAAGRAVDEGELARLLRDAVGAMRVEVGQWLEGLAVAPPPTPLATPAS